MRIIVEVSARHVHISQNDLERLFGKKHTLTPLHPISQHGQFAAVETLDIKHGGKIIKGLRIVGPPRQASQVELAHTDARALGLKVPVRLSGNHVRTPGITLIGPKGRVRMNHGVLIPQRHIHASPGRAHLAGLKEGSIVTVLVQGKRPITFHSVYVRVHPSYRWHMHVDTDEGNAVGIKRKAVGTLTNSI